MIYKSFPLSAAGEKLLLPINAESAFMYPTVTSPCRQTPFNTWGIHKHLKYIVLVWSARYLLTNNQLLTQCTGLTSGTIVYPHIEVL